MERMPPELLYEVGKYLPLPDAFNYRLVDKHPAAVGAAKVFHHLIFHASCASFQRVHAVAAHPVLRRHVRVLVWDANLWNVGANGTTLEAFRRYMQSGPRSVTRTTRIEESLAARLGIDYKTLFEDHLPDIEFEVDRQYSTYCDNVAEETNVLDNRLGPKALKPILRRFTALSSVIIANGDFHYVDDEVRSNWMKYGRGSGVRIPMRPEPKHEQLLARGEGVCDHSLKIGPPGQFPLKNAILAVGSQLKSLTVAFVSFKVFDTDRINCFLALRCPYLTKLELTFTMHSGYLDWDDEDDIQGCRAAMKKGHLKRFIHGFQCLQHLELYFIWKSDYYDGAPNLAHVLPHFETSEQYIIDLLSANAATLKGLSLEDFYLKPEGSWVRIFETLRESLRLEDVKIRSDLCDSVHVLPVEQEDDEDYSGLDDGWYFGEGGYCMDSTPLEEFLKHGGTCPLSHNDKTGVKRGVIEPQ